MSEDLVPEEDPILKTERAKLLARVYAFILSPDWGETDEPVDLPHRRRRRSKQKPSREE